MAKSKKTAAKKASKKVAKKSAKKGKARKSAVAKKPVLQSIMVVSASDRNQARRALAAHFKLNKPIPQERNEARREMALAFKAQ